MCIRDRYIAAILSWDVQDTILIFVNVNNANSELLNKTFMSPQSLLASLFRDPTLSLVSLYIELWTLGRKLMVVITPRAQTGCGVNHTVSTYIYHITINK